MPEPASQTLTLRSGAWYGDRTVSLRVPASWRVRVAAPPPMSPLGDEPLRERLRRPIASPPLTELARGTRSAVIIIDDIMRPTPTARLLPLILDELAAGGLPRHAVSIVIASGAHSTATPEDIRKKVGERLAAELAVVPHDPSGQLTYLGRSARGTPIYVNATVAAAELTIGVGGLYPHPVAGFSGGSKIFMPGVCGVETVRYVHDSFKGAGRGGGRLDNGFRQESEAIAAAAGLSFIVNVILTPDREIADVFAGEMIAAHRAGVEAARGRYRVPVIADADIVITNTYPFDTSLYFIPRGFWPLATGKRAGSRVVIADGSMGQGYHGFKPPKRTLGSRLRRALGVLRPTVKGWRELRVAVTMLRKLVVRTQLEFLMYAPGLSHAELAAKFPKARLFHEWDELLQALARRHGDSPVQVAVYPCAPLQLPDRFEESG
jgi:nickel-dependent lactate racemase